MKEKKFMVFSRIFFHIPNIYLQTVINLVMAMNTVFFYLFFTVASLVSLFGPPHLGGLISSIDLHD